VLYHHHRLGRCAIDLLERNLKSVEAELAVDFG
jgi:hypothetical protein